MFCFFFNDTATTEIYTLSLHDALPISMALWICWWRPFRRLCRRTMPATTTVSFAGVCIRPDAGRSEEHTSELQSRQYLVCRLLLEKKKTQDYELKLVKDTLSL